MRKWTMALMVILVMLLTMVTPALADYEIPWPPTGGTTSSPANPT